MKVRGLRELNFYLSNEAVAFIGKLVNSIDFNNENIGKWVSFADGNGSRCIVLNSSNNSYEVMEYHKKYIDIHITLNGLDKMYIGKEIFEDCRSYQDSDDYGLVKVKNKEVMLIPKDHFLKIETGIPHVNILDQNSVKVVFKIPK